MKLTYDQVVQANHILEHIKEEILETKDPKAALHGDMIELRTADVYTLIALIGHLKEELQASKRLI